MNSSENTPDCPFCKIAAGQIPAEIVYRDELVVAFRDIAPQAPTHLLVIPRRHVASLDQLDDPELGGALLALAGRLAGGEGLSEGALTGGWRLIANTGSDGGQEVHHLHLHVLGGHPLGPMLPG